VKASVQSAVKTLFTGTSWLLFASAGLLFFMGGRAFNEFFKIDRIVAEMCGIGLAFLCGALGAAAKSIADDME
jgi:hypothetical protein